MSTFVFVMWVLALASRVKRRARGRSCNVCMPIALGLAIAVVVNVALEQDPMGSWLNWKALTIDYDAIRTGTELWRLYSISDGEWISRVPETGEYISSGSHFNDPLPW